MTDIIEEINLLITAADLLVVTGSPGTGLALPYTVHRPLIVDAVSEGFIQGDGLWDYQTSLYACAESVQASHNLGLLLMRTLDGQRVAGTTLKTSMGYSGAQVEGHYESQVTVQLNQGAI